MNMKMHCARTLPNSVRVRRTFDMIMHTRTVWFGTRASGSIDDSAEAVRRAFSEGAPDEANAIIGVQIATDVVLYDVGSGGALYLAFAGNPAILAES